MNLSLPLMVMPTLPPAAAVAAFYGALLRTGVALAVLAAAAAFVCRLAGVRLLRQPSSRSRQLLAGGLGALWVLDALLQAQPLMITRFISGVVAPLLQSEPGLLRAVIGLGVRLWGVDPVGWNVFAAYIQLAVGLGILLGGETALRRAALWLSVGWGLGVWLFGEALGGVFAGGSWLSGAPGSALLYVLGAIVLLLPVDSWRPRAWRRWFPRGMAALWLLDAFLEAWPAAGLWGRGGVGAYVSSMAQMQQPAVLAAPLAAWAAAIARAPAVWNGLLVAAMSALAAAWLLRPGDRRLWAVTTGWVLLTWWLGQDFGVLGGTGTDPNSGAVLTLWIAVYAQAVAATAPAAASDPAPAAHWDTLAAPQPVGGAAPRRDRLR